MLFAEATADIGNWTSVVSSVSSIGFTGFLVLYLLTKAFPKMQDDAARSLNEARVEFTKQLQVTQKEYSDGLAAQRAAYVEQLKQQRLDLGTQDSERRQFYEKLLGAQLASAREELARKDDVIKVELSELSHTQERLCTAVEELTKAIRERKV